ncbi:MAG: sensor histidine kinase [Marinospirillum sp.]|uniref:sensor histidine kinase n=1 Tax=Marinospirillum sp. TaxID=2183934 RepID=UPI001A054472|nr:sensor histidine kinase [Marinospirillum sp.]MBE0508810.1 sensor histidine kinase [Marinospirillum sp.]
MKKNLPLHWNLQTRMQLLLLGFCVVLLLVSGYLARFYLQAEFQGIFIEQQRGLVSQQVLRIRNDLLERQTVLEAHAPFLHDGKALLSLDQLQKHLHTAWLSGRFNDFGLLDAEATMLVDYPNVPARLGANYSDRAFIQQAIAEKKTVISPAMIGRTTGIPYYFIATPLLDENQQLLGILVGNSSLAAAPLFKQLRKEIAATQGQLLIIDRPNRVYIAATDANKILQPLPRKGEDPVLDAILTGHDSGRVVDQQQRAWLYVSSDYPEMQWSVIKLAPESEVFAPVDGLLGRYTLILLVIFASITLLGAMLLHRVLRPVRQAIAQIQQAVSRREVLAPLEITGDNEISQLFEAFNRLQLWRDEQARVKDELVAVVSHELRTPLTSIVGALSLVSSGSMQQYPDQQASLLQIAERNAKRLSLLVNDLLDLASLNKGQLRLDMKCQALQPLLEQLVADFSPFARDQKGIKIRLEQPAKPLLLMVDAARLNQVMTNLLSNAVKFSPRNTQVQVLVTRAKDKVRITVTDQGEGIPLAFQSRIFERFAQADSSEGLRAGGTGLGLAITRELLTAMNGRIGFSSLPGSGSCFFLELPRMDTSCNEMDEVSHEQAS